MTATVLTAPAPQHPDRAPASAPARAPHLHALPTPGAAPARRFGLSPRAVLVAVGLVLAVFSAQLAMTMVITHDAYETDSLEAQQLELSREHSAALERADAAASPQHLAAEATKLGMVPRTHTNYLDLQAASILTPEFNTAIAPGQPIDASLVPNKVLQSKQSDEDAKAAQDGKGGAAADPAAAGAPAKPKPKPAVPSEFEVAAPTTR